MLWHLSMDSKWNEPSEILKNLVSGDEKTWRVYSRSELRDMLRQAMDEVLNGRERLALYVRFGLWHGYEHSTKELAQFLECSQSRACSIVKNALDKLKRTRFATLVTFAESQTPDSNIVASGLPAVVRVLIDRFVPRKTNELTPMEKIIFNYVGEGLGNEEIAFKLNISKNTVRSHMKMIYRKLKIKSRLKLTVYAVKKLQEVSNNE